MPKGLDSAFKLTGSSIYNTFLHSIGLLRSQFFAELTTFYLLVPDYHF